MLKIDLHLHTLMSGHGHNTVLEYISQAKKLKMKVIGISDHGPDVIGCMTNKHYFSTLRRIPDVVDGVRVIKGVEANIIDIKGNLDVPDDQLKRLDYVLANIHIGGKYKAKDKVSNTKAIINCIRSGKIDVLSHPFFEKDCSFDIKQICEEACKNDVLLEIDIAYVKNKNLVNEKTIINLQTMLQVVKKFKGKVIVNSDAHNIWELGDDSPLNKELKKKIGLTDDMIINNYPEELEKMLGVKF